MIRRFCDVCEQEITTLNPSVVRDRLILERAHLRANRPKVSFEIHVAIDGTWNSGDLCRSCLYQALDRLDPRPKEGAPS